MSNKVFLSGEPVPRPLAHVVASLFGECAQITVARDVLQRDDPMIIMQLLVYNSECNASVCSSEPHRRWHRCTESRDAVRDVNLCASAVTN